MSLSNIQMQILSSMSRITFYIMEGKGVSTHIINRLGVTKAMKMLPDFRSEILSTRFPTWTVLDSI